MTEPERPLIELTAERQMFANDFIAVYDDDVVFGGVQPGRYLRIVERGGLPGAAVLARSADRYALVLTYRYPTGAYEWGIPRGFAHSADPEVTARNELSEELGGAPRKLTPLGAITPNSGILAGRVHMFLGEFDDEVAAPADKLEVVQVRWVSAAELFGEIAEGKVSDAFTLSAVALATARGLMNASRR